MEKSARGYISSGEFNGYRVPQHIQNQIVRLYCEANGLIFVLSRAEYWINGGTQAQLWAALREGYKHIVFFSLWQITDEVNERIEIYQFCRKNSIVLHFATERFCSDMSIGSLDNMELLIQSFKSIAKERDKDKGYLERLKSLI